MTNIELKVLQILQGDIDTNINNKNLENIMHSRIKITNNSN